MIQHRNQNKWSQNNHKTKIRLYVLVCKGHILIFHENLVEFAGKTSLIFLIFICIWFLFFSILFGRNLGFRLSFRSITHNRFVLVYYLFLIQSRNDVHSKIVTLLYIVQFILIFFIYKTVMRFCISERCFNFIFYFLIFVVLKLKLSRYMSHAPSELSYFPNPPAYINLLEWLCFNMSLYPRDCSMVTRTEVVFRYLQIIKYV